MKRTDDPSRDRAAAWLDRLRLDEGDGPALPIADDAALELVRRARERCEPAPRSRLSRLPKWPLIGIGLVAASSAAAAALGELPHWLGMWAAPAETPPNDAVAVAKSTPEKKRREANTPRAAVVVPTAAASGGAAPVGAPSPPLPAPVPLTAAAPAAEGASKRSVRPPIAAQAERETSRRVAIDSPRAADLLGAANLARAERHYAAALATYRDVIERYPDTRQAQIAAVAAGELELERGDARAAEPLFQRVPHDAEVGAEALFGLSEAYRAQARVVEERRALDRFVQLYASNPLAAAAQYRLSQIEQQQRPQPDAGATRGRR